MYNFKHWFNFVPIKRPCFKFYLLWWQNSSDEYKAYYENIYLTDNEKIYKIVDGEFEECTVREIMERNITGTTIKKCKIKLFFTGNLQ